MELLAYAVADIAICENLGIECVILAIETDWVEFYDSKEERDWRRQVGQAQEVNQDLGRKVARNRARIRRERHAKGSQTVI